MGKCSEKAVNNFKSGYNCAQSVFAAFGDITGIDEKTALEIAGGFGGGVKVLPGVTIGAAYLMKCTDSFLMMVLLAGFVFAISGLRELKNPENAFWKKRN